jgi:hypothetical protein
MPTQATLQNMTTSDRDPTEYALQQEQDRDTVAEEEFLAGPGDTASAGYDYDAVAHALAIGPDSTAAERTIDITTLGARSGIRQQEDSILHLMQ